MKLFIRLPLLFTFFVFFITNSLAQNYIIDKTIEKDSSYSVTYKTKDGKSIKVMRFTKDGIREGVSEEWYYYDNNEVTYIVSKYVAGVLTEISINWLDGTLIEKSIFKNGIEICSITINAAKSTPPNQLYYVKKVYNTNCGFMQYDIFNGTVIDSVQVSKGR